MTSVRSLLALAALLAYSSLSVPLLQAQATHPLTGRRIAPVMGVAGADWLDRSERESEELPEKALEAIKVEPGMTVADIGAGIGYFTLRLAKLVGPQGRVFATDVQPEMLARLKNRAERADIDNIETVLSSEADPKLPAKTFDLLLLVDVYHEFSQPQVMLQKLRQALKPNGRLVLLEYRKEDPHIPIRPEHKMSVREAQTEVEAEGFKLKAVLKDLPRQHILIFQQKADSRITHKRHSKHYLHARESEGRHGPCSKCTARAHSGGNPSIASRPNSWSKGL